MFHEFEVVRPKGFLETVERIGKETQREVRVGDHRRVFLDCAKGGAEVVERELLQKGIGVALVRKGH